MKKTIIPVVAVALTALAAGSVQEAFAAEGDKLLRAGAARVSPNDASRGVVPEDAVGVDDGNSIYVTGTYMVSDNLGVELLAALPFAHDITLDGVGKIAETDHLPPTLSLTYHMNTESRIRPYVGVGINYTTFFNEKATAAISKINLSDSWGLAWQAGVDMDINEKMFFNASFRYIDISTKASTDLGRINVDIDPWVFSIGIGARF
jgi:outer membrane protein